MGEVPAAPSGVWTGRNLVIVVVLLVITNAVTGVAVYFVTPRAAEPAMLRVIGPWSGSEMDNFLPTLEAFTADTGIETQYIIIRQEDLQPVLPTQFENGQTPGDIIFMVESFIRDFGEDGHAVDVTDRVDPAKYTANALDAVTVDSTIYGAAFTGAAKPGFWYKKSFFTANNLEVPTTFAEFQTLLADIAGISGIVNPIVSGDGVGWPLSDVTEHFLATYGGADMNTDLISGDIAFTSTAVKNVFATNLVPLLEADYFSEPVEWTSGVEAFWNEDYALYFMGSWITGMDQIGDSSDLGLFALPGGVAVADQGVVFAPNYFFVPEYTDMMAEALQLFDYLAGPEGQGERVQAGGALPTHLDVDLSGLPGEADVVASMEGKSIIADMDDTIGGDFQQTFWTQLQLLWVSPDQLDNVLAAIDADAP